MLWWGSLCLGTCPTLTARPLLPPGAPSEAVLLTSEGPTAMPYDLDTWKLSLPGDQSGGQEYQ